MEKLPIKTIRYGQSEYVLPYEIFLVNKKTKLELKHTHNKSIRRKLSKYFYDVEKHRPLSKMIETKYDNFERFVKKETKRLFETKEYEIHLRFFKISKAFLSYIIQNKDKIKNIFSEYEGIQIYKYYIPEFEDIFKCKRTNDITNKRHIIEDGMYQNIEVIDIDKNPLNINVSVIQGKLYVAGEPMSRFINVYGGAWIYEKDIIEANTYDTFKQLLENYDKTINSSNDSWEDAIKSKVNKMIKYAETTSLEEMQEEYKKANKERARKYEDVYGKKDFTEDRV